MPTITRLDDDPIEIVSAPLRRCGRDVDLVATLEPGGLRFNVVSWERHPSEPGRMSDGPLVSGSRRSIEVSPDEALVLLKMHDNAILK